MSWIRVLLALMVAAATAHASITAAWKIPVERVAPSFADAPPLAKPPGDSAFFQPGDKLWDLSRKVTWRVPDEAKVEGQGDPFAPEDDQVEVAWKGDWIVWNSRSGMIVARGSWSDILVAEQALAFFESPIVVRTRVEVSDAKNRRALSLVSRVGESATFELQGLRATTEAHTSVTPYGEIDSRLEISWPSDTAEDRWEVASAVSMEDSRKLCLARQGDWQLFVTATRELTDGTPWSEARWLETEAGLRPWSPPRWTFWPDRKQIGANRWLGIYRSVPTFLERHLEKARSEKIPDVEAPAELREWVRGPLVDVRKTLAEVGVKSEEGDIIGYDPVSDLVFVLAGTLNQDLVETILVDSVIDDREFVPPIWIETNPESGGWGLANRSGETADIRKSGGNSRNDLIFHSEASRGANGFIFDLHYTLDVVAGDTKLGKLEAATTLAKDKPQVIGSGTTSDGKEVKVIVTASHPRE